MWWALWWVWVSIGIGLAILEVLVPGFIFLGFAAGAVLTGVLLGLAGPAIGGSLAGVALIFAVLSLVSWLVLRRVLGGRHGQVKIIRRDINDD